MSASTSVDSATPRPILPRSGEEGGPRGVEAAPSDPLVASHLQRRTARCARAQRFFKSWAVYAWSSVMGLPHRLLAYHTVYLACSLICVLSFFELVFLFPLLMYAHEKRTLSLVAATALCLAPCAVSAMQAAVVWRAREACATIVHSFYHNGRRIDEQMKAHARSVDLIIAKRCSIFLCSCFVLCLIFKTHLPPCSRFSKCILASDMHMEMLPCLLLEVFCPIFFVVHFIFAVWVHCLPWVISRFQLSFVPEGAVGLPKDMLNLFHTYSFSCEANGAIAGVDASTCSICIEDYKEGDEIRRLPCGHHFHANCVDAWLSTKPVCPMRCHESLWDAVRSLAAEAGLPPPALIGTGGMGYQPPTI